ncbi:MAG: endonuclease/exonuclease/phosphatase family protein [Granulosicoccus sp.]|nr:endonuclease/exonuclease/phosphatase family protein [Granulosicoccus sp.]
MFNRTLQILAALFLLSGLMSFFSDMGWLFDLASHFPVQSVVALTPLLLLACLRKLKITLWVIITALGINITALASTEWLADKQHLAPATLSTGTPYRLMTLNVLAGNTEYEKIGNLITRHEPDSVLILELTPPLADHLAAQLTDYPYFFGQPVMRAAGIGVFSRHPMQHTELLALGHQFTPAVHIEQTLPPTSGSQHSTLTLIGIHPWAPIAPEMHQLRTIQLRELGSAVKDIHQPLVVAGDFNITPWSKDFRSLLTVGQLADSRVGFGIQGTWPSCLPLLSIPIDHILTSPGLSVKDRRVVRIEGSDHCGVMADLMIQ